MSRSEPTNPLVIAGSVASILVTGLIALALIRAAPRSIPTSGGTAGDLLPSRRLTRGVHARIGAGDVMALRDLPALSFRVDPGLSLDRRVAPGPFEGVFDVTFSPGRVRSARLGAEIRGGQIIVRRGQEILASSYAGDERQTVLTNVPARLGSRLQEIQYEFRADGDRPAALRAVWQPETSSVPLPLPTSGSDPWEDHLRGLVLARQLRCASCHRSDDEVVQAEQTVASAPHLGEIGARARPDWIRRWLADPPGLKPGTAMPRLFHGHELDRERIEDLTHFLVSMGGPVSPDAPPDPGAVATGMLRYHEVGCVPCHGPLEARSALPGAWGDDEPVSGDFVPLGPLGEKTTVRALAGFLEDPLRVRPDGRMPSLSLSAQEAGAIAAYLIDHASTGEPDDTAGEPFALDRDRVARGRSLYAGLGCAACHELGPDLSPIESALTARSLENLNPRRLDAGCTARERAGDGPHFAITARERAHLEAWLERLPDRQAPDVPLDRALATMHRLRCAACHSFHGDGGPSSGVSGYFRTFGEADLGDEGRVPPGLSDVGAKLNPGWLREVLEENGRARPYLATRMPQFGAANVGHLPADLAAVAGVAAEADGGPEFSAEHARAGRELVGAAGFNCIQCHDIAGRDATGTPGPDLARMVERLRYGNFARWLHDPARIRPGTRMPSFFVAGRSGFTQHFEGRADEQIRAMWSYLSQGELLPLPEGLADPAGFALDVGAEPLVFRTYMHEAGVRAVACGFPEQVHCAFDAGRCRLALAWQGPFLNASGAWAARGGTETNPERVDWTCPDEPMFVARDTGEAAALRFDGYRLDEARRPVFLYRLGWPGLEIDVSEQPVPERDGLSASLRRLFALSGPPRAELVLRHGGQLVDGGRRGAFEPGRGDETSVVRLDGEGRATFELEVKW